MRRLILGTAGHIDHGKTALVKALTGIDTDRLKEEKERGITVDLGFAEYMPGNEVLFGVVDVPGHEGFIRNMLAGATGMDLVLMVVAADEGIMPQTREHFSIVRLLGVPRMVVAITKADLVEPDWLELVQDEIQDLLQGSPYSSAPIHPVSAVTGQGLDELGQTLAVLGLEAEEKGTEDVARLPIDRVFTVKGAGTVVTGTLWSGELKTGSRVSILPGDRTARIRSLQVHGQEKKEGRSGARVAAGLSGTDVGHHDLWRGQTVVAGGEWSVSWMLTCRVSLLSDTSWELEQGQRVRVHLGTAEVLARAALFESDRLIGGEEGWVQLRLEEPILARVRDHLVLRSYSPVTTLGGGVVAEVLPRKRRKLSQGEGELLEARLGESITAALSALLGMAGWGGVPAEALPHRTGFSPQLLDDAIKTMETEGLIAAAEDRFFSIEFWGRGESRILSSVEEYHEKHPLKPGIPLEELRQVLPGEVGPKLTEAILQSLQSRNRLTLRKGVAFLPDFRPELTSEQEDVRRRLRGILEEAGLAPPGLRELADTLGTEEEIENILRLMETAGEVVGLEREFFFSAQVVKAAGESVIEALAGARDLGPADFRDVLPVTRKHLLPLLRYFDLWGVTTRLGDARNVADEPPKDWGTLGGAGS